MEHPRLHAFSPISARWAYAGATGGLTTTAEATIQAAAAGKRHILKFLQVKNTSATATELEIRDGASGTVIWRGQISASQVNADIYDFGEGIAFSDNKAVIIACVTTGAAVRVSAQGITFNTTGNQLFDANI